MIDSEIVELREKYPHLSDDFIAFLSADSEHALFGASYSHTWMYCAGAIQAGYNLKGHNTLLTIEGSAAHHWAEKARKGEFDLDLGIGDEYIDYITSDNDEPGSKGFEVVVTLNSEMVAHIKTFLEYCDLFIDDDCEVFCEQRVDYSAFVPNGFGTCDLGIYNRKTKKLYSIDLKYGVGLMVFAPGNDQGLIYATGLYDRLSVKYDIETIHVAIVQPRRDHISEATYKAEFLEEYIQTMQDAAHASLSKNPTFTPGESQCQFCKLNGRCEAQADLILGEAIEDFTSISDVVDVEEVEIRNVGVLSNTSLGIIGQLLPQIRKFFKTSEKNMREKLERGEDVAGMKLVAGRNNQYWTDEDAALEMLKKSKLKADQYAPRSMLSVPQMRKHYPNHAVLKKYAGKKHGSDSLVPESAKGADLYREQFDDLDSDEFDFLN
jgi:hypothetical protein